MGRSISERITEFHHLTLAVTDMELAERFYTEVLGAEVVRRMGSHFSIQFAAGPRFDISPKADALHDADHPKYALTISPEDLIECTRILDEHGIGYDGPVHAGPPGAAQIYFDDPFGNHFQLVCQGYADWASLKAGHDKAKLRYTWPREDTPARAATASSAPPARPVTVGPQVSGTVVTVAEAGRYDIKTAECVIRPNEAFEILVNGVPVCSYPNAGGRERRQSLGELHTLESNDTVTARVVHRETGAAQEVVVSIAKVTDAKVTEGSEP